MVVLTKKREAGIPSCAFKKNIHIQSPHIHIHIHIFCAIIKHPTTLISSRDYKSECMYEEKINKVILL